MIDQCKLVDTIATAIKNHARAHDGRRVTRAGIKLSRLASVTPDTVTECFQRAVDRHGLADISLSVEIVPLLGECARCDQVVEIDGGLCCRSCGSIRVEIGDHGTILLDSCEFAH